MECTDLEVGDRLESTWTIKFADNAQPADPPFVLFVVKKPDNTEILSVYNVAGQTYPITRVSAGVYRAYVPLDVAGTLWVRRWNAYDSDGAALAANERTIEVQETAFQTPLPTTE